MLKTMYSVSGSCWVMQADHSEVTDILCLHRYICHVPGPGPQPFRISNLFWSVHQEFIGPTELDTNLSRSWRIKYQTSNDDLLIYNEKYKCWSVQNSQVGLPEAFSHLSKAPTWEAEILDSFLIPSHR